MEVLKRCFVTAAAVAGLTICSPVLAQSSVVIYGLIDTSIAKPDNSDTRVMMTGATSRIGFRGVEDLGSGLRALFHLEHQFNPDTGSQYNASAYFSGRSTVGLESDWGRVTLGREVNPSHYVEAAADPFSQDGLPGGYGARGGISQGNGAPGQIDTVRMNNSINYFYSSGGVTARVQTAAREGVDGNGNKPFSASLIYASSAYQIGISHLNPSKVNDHWNYVSGQYDFGFARLYAGLGAGKNTFAQSVKHHMVGVLIPIESSSIRASYSQTRAGSNTIQQKFALGYYHSLSRRTTVYANVVHDTKAGQYSYGTPGWAPTGSTGPKTGYEFGLRHSF